MNRTELRNEMLFKLDEYYRNTPNEELPEEYQICVNLELGDVMVVEEFWDCPDDYVYVILLDLYEETLWDAVEYVFKQNK